MTEVTDFDNILNSCLERLHQGDTLEACLASYPAQTEHLRPLLQVATQLPPTSQPAMSAEGWQRGEVRLLARASELRMRRIDLTPNPQRFNLFRLFGWSRRLVMIATIIFLLIGFVGMGTVSAANDSLPGSSLYPVKRTAESIISLTAWTPERQTNLHLTWAERRLSEVEALLNRDGSVEEGLLTDLAHETEQALTSAAQGERESLKAVVSQTEQQQQVLGQLLTKAPQAAKIGLARALTAATQRNARAQSALEQAGKPPPMPGEAPSALPTLAEPDVPPEATATATTVEDTLPPPEDGSGQDKETPPGQVDNPSKDQDLPEQPPGQDPERDRGQGQQDQEPPSQGGGPPQNPGNGPDQKPGQNDNPGQGSGPDKDKGKGKGKGGD